MQMVANGYGVTLIPQIAADVERRDERVKLLRWKIRSPAAPSGSPSAAPRRARRILRRWASGQGACSAVPRLRPKRRTRQQGEAGDNPWPIRPVIVRLDPIDGRIRRLHSLCRRRTPRKRYPVDTAGRFEALFANSPNIQWRHTAEYVCGDRAVTEWYRTATTTGGENQDSACCISTPSATLWSCLTRTTAIKAAHYVPPAAMRGTSLRCSLDTRSRTRSELKGGLEPARFRICSSRRYGAGPHGRPYGRQKGRLTPPFIVRQFLRDHSPAALRAAGLRPSAWPRGPRRSPGRPPSSTAASCRGRRSRAA